MIINNILMTDGKRVAGSNEGEFVVQDLPVKEEGKTVGYRRIRKLKILNMYSKGDRFIKGDKGEAICILEEGTKMAFYVEVEYQELDVTIMLVKEEIEHINTLNKIRRITNGN